MPQAIAQIGMMSIWLAILIALWDINNEYLPWILGLGIVSTGVGITLS